MDKNLTRLLMYLLYSIQFKANGNVCECGCTIAECDYCVGEFCYQVNTSL